MNRLQWFSILWMRRLIVNFILCPNASYIILVFLVEANTALVWWSLIWPQRNYRFFFMFISTSTILCLYVFTFSWIIIIQGKGDDILKAMGNDFLSDFLIVYCFVVIWFVGGLTVFHSYLICTNQVIFFLLKTYRNINILKICISPDKNV